MQARGDDEVQEDRLFSSFWGAFQVAGEAFKRVYPHNSTPLPPTSSAAHQSCQSPFPVKQQPALHTTTTFTKFKSQMQRAWRSGNSHEKQPRSSFNPEVLANQKRQWYKLQSLSMDRIKYKEPSKIFEHFFVVGLHPNTNMDAVEEAFAKRKKWEREMKMSGVVDCRRINHQESPSSTYKPQVLFKYPPGKRLAMRLEDLAVFCFPDGVKARLLARTPSMSDLNALLYGQQEHLVRDDLAFIFSLKGDDNATLYGVCLYISEVVQRPPGILGALPSSVSSGTCSRFLASAPRCYCLLTRVPFFELHYEILNSIVAQERLNQITEFASETCLSFLATVQKPITPMNGNTRSHDGEYSSDCMASAIPVDNFSTLSAGGTASPDNEDPCVLVSTCSPRSPESVTFSEASVCGYVQEIYMDCQKDQQLFNANASVDTENFHGDNTPEVRENHHDALSSLYGTYGNSQACQDTGSFYCTRSSHLERVGSAQSLFSSSTGSPAQSIASDDGDEDYDVSPNQEFGDNLVMEWARENKNDILQILCSYHSLNLPRHGSKIVFQPLEHLEAIEFTRPPVSAHGFEENYLQTLVSSEVNEQLAAAEEAYALSLWTTATMCRFLSIQSVLSLLVGVLLEKQVIIVCPNLGVLSATVLSLVPLIRPFQWQSLQLPVLPATMTDFLDAPVPYIIGMQHKPTDFKLTTSNHVHVDVLHNKVFNLQLQLNLLVPRSFLQQKMFAQVKTCNLPALPRYKELISALGPSHARLSIQGSVAGKRPVYKWSDVQAEAAREFLTIMERHLESLCTNIACHAITSVQPGHDRVSLLLKDSYIDSFPRRDQPFIKLFVETQLFSVLSDRRLLNFENSH